MHLKYVKKHLDSQGDEIYRWCCATLLYGRVNSEVCKNMTEQRKKKQFCFEFQNVEVIACLVQRIDLSSVEQLWNIIVNNIKVKNTTTFQAEITWKMVQITP